MDMKQKSAYLLFWENSVVQIVTMQVFQRHLNSYKSLNVTKQKICGATALCVLLV